MFTTLSRSLAIVALAMTIAATGVAGQDVIQGPRLLLNGSSGDVTLTVGDMLNIQAGIDFPQSGTIFLVISVASQGGGLDPSTAVLLASQDLSAFGGLEMDVMVPSLPYDIRVAVQAFVLSDDGRVHASSVSHVKIPA